MSKEVDARRQRNVRTFHGMMRNLTRLLGLVVMVCLLAPLAGCVNSAGGRSPKAVEHAAHVTVNEPAAAIDEDEQKDIDLVLAMEKRMTGTVQFADTPLTKVLDELADRLKVVIEVDWDALKAWKVEPQTPVTIRQSNATADKVLTAILDSTTSDRRSLSYGIRDGRIFVSEFSASQQSVMQVYVLEDDDLRPGVGRRTDSTNGEIAATNSAMRSPELIRCREEKIEQLTTLIQQSVDPDTWIDNGGHGAIRYFNGRLLLTQTPKNHVAVRRLLKKLDVHFHLATSGQVLDANPIRRPSAG